MFRDHQIRILAKCCQRWHKPLVAAVSHRHHRIPAQARKLGATNWRSSKYLAELFRPHFRQPVERRIDESFPRLKLCRGSRGRLAVPRANVLTDVASENVSSHSFAQFYGNLAALLDRQIGDAQPRVQLTCRSDRLRWTGNDAARASSATIGRGQVAGDIVVRDSERSENHAQKQPRSKLLIDDASVLADPSDAGVLRVDALDERTSVNVGAKLPVASCREQSAQLVFDLLQAAQYGVVIVLARPGVARNPASARIFCLRLHLARVGMRGVVVDGAYDHAAGPGSDSLQRRAFEFSSFIARFHVPHFAVLAICDPCGEDAQLSEVSDSDRRNAAEVESRVARALLDAGWKVGKQVGSGSRPVQPQD